MADALIEGGHQTKDFMALYTFQFLNPEMQRAHKEEILAAFDALLETNPDEWMFTQMMRGIILFPEMLYRLVKWGQQK